MKRYIKKYTSLKNYVAFLRRQPEHMQHVYAIIFAGSITALIAFVILYTDYGFWHERYIRDDMNIVATSTVITTTTPTPESPTEMLSRFFQEAGTKLKAINISGKELLQGKETYVKDSQ